MEIKLMRNAFLEGLTKAQGVVERKNTMPILSNILLDAGKNGVRIVGTDLEVTISSHIPAQVLNPGVITLPCRSLHDIIRELDQSEVHLTLQDNQRIQIKSGKSDFTIPGLSGAEFPKLPAMTSPSVELPCDLFSSMISKTSFAMSTDETRHHLAGILLVRENNNKIKMVATDGHRLSLCEEECDVKNFEPVQVIIPRKGIQELKKITGEEGSFEFSVDKKNLFARKGNETLSVRLIDGEFPAYQRVIPEGNDKFATVSKEALVGALRRVSLLSNERSRGVVFNFTSGHLEITINNPDMGEAHEDLEINYKGEKISVGFNAHYFLDVLGVINDDHIIIALNTDLTPCLIKSEKNPGFLSVIMPMRI